MPKGVVVRRWVVWCMVLFSIGMLLAALFPRFTVQGGNNRYRYREVQETIYTIESVSSNMNE